MQHRSSGPDRPRLRKGPSSGTPCNRPRELRGVQPEVLHHQLAEPGTSTMLRGRGLASAHWRKAWQFFYFIIWKYHVSQLPTCQCTYPEAMMWLTLQCTCSEAIMWLTCHGTCSEAIMWLTCHGTCSEGTMWLTCPCTCPQAIMWLTCEFALCHHQKYYPRPLWN